MTTYHGEPRRRTGIRSWGVTRWLMIAGIVAAIVVAIVLIAVYAGGGGGGGY